MGFIADDFTWLRWAHDAHVSEFITYFIDARGFFYRPLPKIIYAFLWQTAQDNALIYHMLSYAIYVLTAYGIYRILRYNDPDLSKIIHFICCLAWLSMSIHHEVVLWVSGYSALFAGFFFVWTWFAYMIKRPLIGHVLLWCMLWCYDGLLLVPWGLAVVFSRYRKSIMLHGLIYIFARSISGAIQQSGDYSYNSLKIPFNSIWNLAVYYMSFVGGYMPIAYAESLRTIWKTQFVSVIFIILMACVLGCVVLLLARRMIMQKWQWHIVILLSLAPYLPLGNAAERYAYIPSIVGTMLCAHYLHKYPLHTRYRRLLIACVSVWFIMQIALWRQVLYEWRLATEITRHYIKTGTIYTSYPVRVGRAWTFPSGTQDIDWYRRWRIQRNK